MRILIFSLLFWCFHLTSFAGEIRSNERAKTREGSAIQSGHGSLSCYDRRLFLQTQIRRNQSVNNTLSDIAKSEKQLIIFGESHVHFEGIKRYPEFIENIRQNRGVNCIFIEAKDRYQYAIDKYIQGSSYESNVELINKKFKDKHPLAHATKELLDYAKSNNIKVFAIDTESENSFIRDQHMSKRASELMRDKCTQPVLLVGKAHVYEKLNSSHSKASESSPIPERLRKMGFSVSSINMISHSGLSDSYNGYSPSCPNKIEIPTKDFGFPIRSPAPAIGNSVFDYFEPEKWDDYQAAIVVN